VLTLFELLGPFGVLGALGFVWPFIRPVTWHGVLSMALGAGACWATFGAVLQKARSNRGFGSSLPNWLGGVCMLGLFILYFAVTAGVTMAAFKLVQAPFFK
jgi:hypothetical protein